MNRLNALRMVWWNACEASTHDRPGFSAAHSNCKSYGAIIGAVRGRRED